jgi:hypothetical protein
VSFRTGSPGFARAASRAAATIEFWSHAAFLRFRRERLSVSSSAATAAAVTADAAVPMLTRVFGRDRRPRVNVPRGESNSRKTRVELRNA